MEVKDAIFTFSQSEKIKAGLIWVSLSLEQISGLTDMEKMGGAKIISSILAMIGQEIELGKTLVGEMGWEERGLL